MALISSFVLLASIPAASAGDVSAPLPAALHQLFSQEEPPVNINFEGHRSGSYPSIALHYDAHSPSSTIAEAAIASQHALAGGGLRYRVVLDDYGTTIVPSLGLGGSSKPAPLLDTIISLEPGRRDIGQLLGEIATKLEASNGENVTVDYPINAFHVVEVEVPVGERTARNALGYVLHQYIEESSLMGELHTNWRLVYSFSQETYVLSIALRVIYEDGVWKYPRSTSPQ